MADYQSKSVVTVGTRATLPSIYVENETSGNSGGATSLRYRNRLHDDDLNNNDRLKCKSLESPEVASLGSSIRSSPSYGTPGTSARWVVLRYALKYFGPKSIILPEGHSAMDKALANRFG